MFVLVHQYLYQCYLLGIPSRFTVCKLHHVKFPKVEAREPTCRQVQIECLTAERGFVFLEADEKRSMRGEGVSPDAARRRV